MATLHVIYIPGIGDDSFGQGKIVKTWRWWGVEPELFSMHWGDRRPWDSKCRELLERIDTLTRQGNIVGLVGASAGASAAINAFAECPTVVGVVCIAGMINRPDTIVRHFRQNNPSFVESAYRCQEALRKLGASRRQQILSRYALIDEVIRKENSQIPGARNRRSPSIGHFLTITTQITLGAPSFLRFLKKQADTL
jgi:hypothetical protein